MLKNTLLLTFLFVSSNAHSLPILSVTGSGDGGTPAAGTSHGWTFTANQNLWITDLGLYDSNDDGFDITHDIGLFRESDGLLLTSGTLSSGTSNTLLDGFRYVDTVDVMLNAGDNYIISYFSLTNSDDWVATTAQGLVVDPLITILNGNWEYTNSLSIPANQTSADRIGPNFLYSSSAISVPEPSSLSLLFAGLLFWAVGRRVYPKNQ